MNAALLRLPFSSKRRIIEVGLIKNAAALFRENTVTVCNIMQSQSNILTVSQGEGILLMLDLPLTFDIWNALRRKKLPTSYLQWASESKN